MTGAGEPRSAEVPQKTKRERPCPRDAYHLLPRRPVVIVSFNDKDWNSGSLVRTAEAFLLERVHFARRPEAWHSSGAEQWQPVSTGDWQPVVEEYRAQGYRTVALELTDRSVSLFETELPGRMILLVGAEVTGVPDEALAMADMCVEIPLDGFTRSLNLSVATGMVIFRWLSRWRPHYPVVLPDEVAASRPVEREAEQPM